MFFQLIKFVLLFGIAHAHPEVHNFCDPKWCPDQGNHIACNNTGSFGSSCTGEYWLEDINPYQELILSLHNEARNKLALGLVPGYESCGRMPFMKWNDDLAAMAELNVKTCYFEHDECRSTVDFPYSGQNIYYAKTTLTNYTIEDFIKEAVDMWFLEHKDGDMDLIKSFKITDPQTGHFTTLMSDRNDQVGCAYLFNVIERQNLKTLIKVIFTCNYPSMNIIDFPTYMPDLPASLCQNAHQFYEGLCGEDEVIDPNDFMWYFDEKN